MDLFIKTMECFLKRSTRFVQKLTCSYKRVHVARTEINNCQANNNVFRKDINRFRNEIEIRQEMLFL